ncbi:argininosuccinate lyase, partial [Streptococcus pneumoniae]
MELVLPNNYVVIDEEEMMYLDGGAIYIPRRSHYWCSICSISSS